MPQVTKGGKFIFGWCKIHQDLSVIVPPQTVKEYDISEEEKVILVSGSKSSGGFCVTTEKFLKNSQLKNVIYDNPKLVNQELEYGKFIKYKGRIYSWAPIENGVMRLSSLHIEKLKLEEVRKLVCIRSSNITFTLAAYGPIVERVSNYTGKIEEF